MKKIKMIGLLLLLGGCSQLESLTTELTPTRFLENMPYARFTFGEFSFVLIQPSSTFFVYLLGILTILLGILFLKNHMHQKSRVWWGIGMVLWGIGAIVAGSSYQAFGYELKCANRYFCLQTSWVEFLYLGITIFSMNALLMGMVYRMKSLRQRRIVAVYAAISCLGYTLWLLKGLWLANAFMVSYEALLIFLAPTILLYFLSVQGKSKGLDKKLRNTWIYFLLLNLAYFAWLYSGISNVLYHDFKIWLNENDILHLLLIVWMFYQYKVLYPNLEDESLK